jgi:hypothetical protein
MTAAGVGAQVASPPQGVLATTSGLAHVVSGEAWGNLFWGITLLCGFLVLGPSVVSTIDGVIRRWLDTFWTASRRLRQVEPGFIKHLYFRVLVTYTIIGLVTLWLNKPAALLKYATIGYNLALGFSCWHTLAVNMLLLPRDLRPSWPVRAGMVLAGFFFLLLGIVVTLKEFEWLT